MSQYLKPGDIKKLWGFGVCVILSVEKTQYYALNTLGEKCMIPMSTSYSTVQLDKSLRDSLYEYYLTERELTKTTEKIFKLTNERSELERKLVRQEIKVAELGRLQDK